MIPLQTASKDTGFQMPALRFGLSYEQEKEILKISEKMLTALKSIRSPYEGDWKTLGDNFAPHLVKINDNTESKKSKWASIINPAPRFALRTLASGMQSGLTSPASPWLKIGIEDTDLMEFGAVKKWLQDETKAQMQVFRRSNFYNTVHSMYAVQGLIGTAGQMMTEDKENTVLFRGLMTGRYWAGMNARGYVDRIVILRRMTVTQMVEDFGLENCDRETQDSFNRSDYFFVKDVFIAIFPNPFKKNPDADIIASNEKPFVSCYWTEGKETPLKTSGYNSFPCQVPRWEVSDEETYGVGLGLDGIGNAKSLQMKEREKGKAIKKMVAPPKSVPSTMRDGQYPTSSLPGSVNVRPPGVAADEIKSSDDVSIPLQHLVADMQLDEERLNKVFYADLFLLLANTQKKNTTAYEIAKLHEEKLIQLGPVVERNAHEHLDLTIKRNLELRMLRGDIAPLPKELDGVPLKLEYISMLAQAQKQVGVGAIERYVSFGGLLAQYHPSALDKIDPDQAMDRVGDMYGVPTDIIVSDSEVAKIRAARAEKEQAMQQAETGMAGVAAAKQLSETQMGSGSALDQIMGTQ